MEGTALDDEMTTFTLSSEIRYGKPMYTSYNDYTLYQELGWWYVVTTTLPSTLQTTNCSPALIGDAILLVGKTVSCRQLVMSTTLVIGQ